MLFVKRFSAYINYQNGRIRSSEKPHVIRETLQCLRKIQNGRKRVVKNLMLFVKRFSAYAYYQNGRKRSSENPHVIRETVQCLSKLPERQDTE
jgi:hypothetical protein